jgi:Arc/MetJ-type ribon-helix-helix transcriptional regulator
MQTKRVTVTIPEEVAEAAEEAVHAGKARSVSAYFAEAARSYGRTESLDSILDDLDAVHGSVPDDVMDQVRAELDGLGLQAAPDEERLAG